MKSLLKLSLAALFLTVVTTFAQAMSVNYSLESVEIIESKGPFKLAPTTVLKGKTFLVSFPKSAGTISSISIRDYYGEVLFTEKPEYTGKFDKAYNMTKLDPGSYVVIIKTDIDTFYKYVRL